MARSIDDRHPDNDALRLEDIVPPFDAAARKPEPAGKSATPINKRKKSLRTSDPAQPCQPGRIGKDIPRFDLAEQIMSEQRRRTLATRKSPALKKAAPPEQPAEVSSPAVVAEPDTEEHRIVAEMVARDIERFCRRDTALDA
jgi:hypothetical protein